MEISWNKNAHFCMEQDIFDPQKILFNLWNKSCKLVEEIIKLHKIWYREIRLGTPENSIVGFRCIPSTIYWGGERNEAESRNKAGTRSEKKQK